MRPRNETKTLNKLLFMVHRITSHREDQLKNTLLTDLQYHRCKCIYSLEAKEMVRPGSQSQPHIVFITCEVSKKC